jgi:hypothetical protein
MKQTFWAVLSAAVLMSASTYAQQAPADNAQGNQDRAAPPAAADRARDAAPPATADRAQDAPINPSQPDNRARQSPARPEPSAEVFRDPGQRPNADQLPQQGNLPADRAPRATPADPNAGAPQDTLPQGDARLQDNRNRQLQDNRNQQLQDNRNQQLQDDRNRQFQDNRNQQFQDDRQFRGDANVQGGANFDAQVQSGQQDNQWRYKWHSNRWWYWTPENKWVVWIDNQWQPYSQGMFSTGSNFDSGYASSGYSTGTAMPSYSYSPSYSDSPGYSYSPGYSSYSYNPGYSNNYGNYGYSYPSYGSYGSYPNNYGRSGVYLNFGSPRYSSGYRGFGGYPGYGYGGYRGYGGYGGYGNSGGVSIGRGGVGFGIRF